jgi:hypothetical protein
MGFVLESSPMATRDARQPTSNRFILLIFIGVLVDAVLFAHVRANFLHDHGYDVSTPHRAVAKPPPP